MEHLLRVGAVVFETVAVEGVKITLTRRPSGVIPEIDVVKEARKEIPPTKKEDQEPPRAAEHAAAPDDLHAVHHEVRHE